MRTVLMRHPRKKDRTREVPDGPAVRNHELIGWTRVEKPTGQPPESAPAARRSSVPTPAASKEND